MNDFTHGGNIYANQSPTGSWLDFSANINPLGLALSVKQAITDNIDAVVNYPDPNAKEAKAAIASFYGIDSGNIALGNGAAELFYVWFNAYRPKSVLIPVPSFGEYERAAIAAKVKCFFSAIDELNDFHIDGQKVLKEFIDCECLILGNPNNPTGRLVSRDLLDELISFAEKNGKTLLLDESFLDFPENGDKLSLRKKAAHSDNLVVFQSLTKFYALPGLRLGFAVASEKTIARLEAGKDPWNMNLLAQKATVAALKCSEYQRKSRDLLQAEKEFMTAELCKIKGLKIYLPSVNFILLNTKKLDINADELTERMKEYGILIRNCANYHGLDDYFVRVAIKNRTDNEKLITALKDCLNIKDKE